MSPNPPAAFQPPPAAMVKVQDPEVLPAEQTMAEFSPSATQPSRLNDDVWAYLQEFRQAGGLLDPGEEIAALINLEAEVRAEKGMKAGERNKQLQKIISERARLKQIHLNILKEKRDFLTLDLFIEFLEELYVILSEELGDPFLLQSVGVKIKVLAKRMHSKMGSK